jgi:hypothetical protein
MFMKSKRGEGVDKSSAVEDAEKRRASYFNEESSATSIRASEETTTTRPTGVSSILMCCPNKDVC